MKEHTNTTINAALDEFHDTYGIYVPKFVTDFLRENLCIALESSEKRAKVTAFNGHSFEEIDAHLHALFIGMISAGFNHIYCKHTGHIVLHACGCDDCAILAEFSCLWAIEHVEMLGEDYVQHLQQELLGFQARVLSA